MAFPTPHPTSSPKRSSLDECCSSPIIPTPREPLFKEWMEDSVLYHTDHSKNNAVEMLSEAGLVFLSFRMACRRSTKEDFTCPLRMELSELDVDLVENILAYKNRFEFVYQDHELNQRVFYALVARKLGIAPIDREAVVVFSDGVSCCGVSGCGVSGCGDDEIFL